MVYVIIAVLLVGVVWLVSAPLLRGRSGARDAQDEVPLESAQRIDLEAARDAKYREIRDAELDHETGKLSDEDFAAIDSALRAEAIELLHQIDELDGLDETRTSERP